MKSSSTIIAQIPRKYLLAAGVVVVIAVLFLVYRIFHPAKASMARARPASEQVTVASVASLSPENAPLSVIGNVASQDEATILSETSGEIVNVNKQIGDSVSAGDVIATFENSSQQAAVLQAQGQLAAANAALSEASGTTAENSTITSTQAAQDVSDTESAVEASLQSAYTALDDAIHTKTDSLFNNPRTSSPTLIPSILPSDNQVVLQVENERSTLEATLADASSMVSTASDANIDTNVNEMITDAGAVETLLGNLANIVNQTLPNGNISAATIESYQSAITAARTEVVTAITNLTASRTTYDAAVASASTAANSASGATPDNIASAQAQVQEAQGAYDAAKAALDKTIVTSPISGSIIALPVTTGDYVNSFTEIAEVSNPGALKVTTYVTSDDAATLSVGNSVTINGTVPGVITQIAPAIDPETGTIEVDVGLTGNTGLVDGDSVTVDIDRNPVSTTTTPSPASASGTATPASVSATIPIVALKITPTGPAVFTVDAKTNSLVSNPVQTGSILGDDIVVTEGLTPGMMIVTDARGLTSGEIVSVKSM